MASRPRDEAHCPWTYRQVERVNRTAKASGAAGNARCPAPRLGVPW
ncbi:hypothetical protein [Cryobacterium sp. PH29-G1]|nr:hypothetical protein [Cryobacterium sp. PH29-G1]MDJ0350022.1 hypothetical protein [Cryobacterium sp. PH29-G1]